MLLTAMAAAKAITSGVVTFMKIWLAPLMVEYASSMLKLSDRIRCSTVTRLIMPPETREKIPKPA